MTAYAYLLFLFLFTPNALGENGTATAQKSDLDELRKLLCLHPKETYMLEDKYLENWLASYDNDLEKSIQNFKQVNLYIICINSRFILNGFLTKNMKFIHCQSFWNGEKKKILLRF